MERRKQDRRVVKTKRAIRNAFVSLLAKKDYNDISIKNIADAADVDRKTVYNYYKGIYAIRDELENDIVAMIDKAVEALDFANGTENVANLYGKLTEIVDENIELCQVFLRIDANSQFVQKMMDIFAEKLQTAMEKGGFEGCSREKLAMAATFVSSGTMAVYQRWFNGGCVQPIDELSKSLGYVIWYGVRSLTPAYNNYFQRIVSTDLNK